MRATAALLVGTLLTGCASSTMNRVMSSWEGEHIDTVVRQWGYPSAEREFRGRKLYVWGDSGAYIIPSQSTTSGTVDDPRTGAFTANTFTVGGGVVPASCTRVLEVDADGIVRSWQWQGNNCCVMTVAGHCASLPNPRR